MRKDRIEEEKLSEEIFLKAMLNFNRISQNKHIEADWK